MLCYSRNHDKQKGGIDMTVALIVISLIVLASIKIYVRISGIMYEVSVVFTIFWSFLTLVVIIVVIASVGRFYNNSLRRPSPVNISPIATLNEENFERAGLALQHLAGLGYVREPTVFEHQIRRSYSSTWISPVSGTSMSIWINYENNEANFTSWEVLKRDHPHHQFIQNDNGTVIFAIHPRMVISHGLALFPAPTDSRYIQTRIRMGTIQIELFETRPWYTMRNNYSSQFIELFVETLQNH